VHSTTPRVVVVDLGRAFVDATRDDTRKEMQQLASLLRDPLARLH
jgi:hypothetical protein